MIQPDADYLDEAVRVLREASAAQGNHFQVYRKEDLPQRWLFGGSPLVYDIVAVSDVGYGLDYHTTMRGSHGWVLPLQACGRAHA